MKKKVIFHNFLQFLLVSILSVLLYGMTVSAAGSKIVDMVPDADGTYMYTADEPDSSTTMYHRISVPASGALGVSGGTYSAWGSSYGIRVTLCDSGFKELSESAYINASAEDLEMYGVKKGTYYIKVTGEDKYVIAASFKKQSDKAGSSKAKAKTVKHNKEMAGVMAAGEKAKTADWYKFKVTKSKKLQLNFSMAGTGYFDFYIYGPSYPKGLRVDSISNESNKYFSINSLNRKKIKVKTGTYYIKVVRASYSKKASGVYSVKWRLK